MTLQMTIKGRNCGMTMPLVRGCLIHSNAVDEAEIKALRGLIYTKWF